MKSIFIFWTERLNEYRGGVHRIILLLLKYLPLKGFKVTYIYTLDNYNTFFVYDKTKQEKKVELSNLRTFLLENNCEIILGQDAGISTTLTRLVRQMQLPGVTFINEYHVSFLYLINKLTKEYLLFEYDHTSSTYKRINCIIKYVFYRIWKILVWEKVKKIHRYTILNSDINLLLSKQEEKIISSIVSHNDNPRCVIIPNPLSLEEIADSTILKAKEKEVLVVSRIYNPEKRIDLVLKIWKELQDRGVVNDWTLRIVGDGIHKAILMQYAEQLNLRNVIWEGWSDPKPFYKKASLFMMTSACEGWGLTLTESMQNGVVPIAFNNYLAVNDIITSGYDGYIINGNDIIEYANTLENLILDKSLRETIALNGLESCKRFLPEVVIDKWVEMLASI